MFFLDVNCFIFQNFVLLSDICFICVVIQMGVEDRSFCDLDKEVVKERFGILQLIWDIIYLIFIY